MLKPEEALLQQVLQLAHHCGWRTAHFRPAREAHGWRTAVSGDGKGWPDLVLVRRERIVFAELKSDEGRLSTDQEAWLVALRAAHDEVYQWAPRDWAQIQEVLR